MTTTPFRIFTKRLFILFTIGVVFLFLLACANAFLHPERWWFFALLGLAFPFLLLFTVVLFFFWAFFRSRWVFVPFAALLIGFTNIRALIGFHFGKKFRTEKTSETIRILTWNVNRFTDESADGQSGYRKDLLQIVKREEPDVICFQEYLEPNPQAGLSIITKNLEEMGYGSRFVVTDYSRTNGTYHVGVAIFSRHPFIDSLRIRFQGPRTLRAAESLIACDITVHGKTIRIYTTHLQSVLLQKKDYRDLDIIRNAKDSMVEASRSILRKLKQGYSLRGDQVDLVRQELDRSPYPAIVCGDFNDVPNSYTYFQIKGDWNDAFVEKGSGMGRTFANLSPTLRIDYVMADKRFEVLQYKRQVISYSEHYPILVDFQLP
ncbi:MAG TPA: endonuclease/exonuclease/phosphatase family protein [Flavitalea sp.]|nr:endonuclease/exonuclease/phosphatase family protein [Flavitalea sp.]